MAKHKYLNKVWAHCSDSDRLISNKCFFQESNCLTKPSWNVIYNIDIILPSMVYFITGLRGSSLRFLTTKPGVPRQIFHDNVYFIFMTYSYYTTILRGKKSCFGIVWSNNPKATLFASKYSSIVTISHKNEICIICTEKALALQNI